VAQRRPRRAIVIVVAGSVSLFFQAWSVGAAESLRKVCRLPDGVRVTPLAPQSDPMARAPRVDPVLYWHQSGPLDRRIRVSWEVEPVFGQGRDLRGRTGPLSPTAIPRLAGFGAVDLRRAGFRMVPGRQYEWALVFTLPGQGERRCGGRISSVPRFEPGGSPADRAGWLVRTGHWYGAVRALRRALAINPNGRGLASAWRELMLQGGLPEVALSP